MSKGHVWFSNICLFDHARNHLLQSLSRMAHASLLQHARQAARNHCHDNWRIPLPLLQGRRPRSCRCLPPLDGRDLPSEASSQAPQAQLHVRAAPLPASRGALLVVFDVQDLLPAHGADALRVGAPLAVLGLLQATRRWSMHQSLGAAGDFCFGGFEASARAGQFTRQNKRSRPGDADTAAILACLRMQVPHLVQVGLADLALCVFRRPPAPQH